MRFDCDWSSDVCSSDLRERDAGDERRLDDLISEVRMLRDGSGQHSVEMAKMHGLFTTTIARLEPIAADVTRDRHTARERDTELDAKIVALDRRVLALEQRS